MTQLPCHLLICEDDDGHHTPFLRPLWEGMSCAVQFSSGGKGRCAAVVMTMKATFVHSPYCLCALPAFCSQPIEMGSPLTIKRKPGLRNSALEPGGILLYSFISESLFFYPLIFSEPQFSLSENGSTNILELKSYQVPCFHSCYVLGPER